MAAPPNRTTQEGRIIDNHAIELQNKQNRAESAYTMLDTYNWNGVGTMPGFSWTSPNGKIFTYTPGLGELEYDGTVYSGLNAIKKREFFQYLPRFIAECMKRYDQAYNL